MILLDLRSVPRHRAAPGARWLHFGDLPWWFFFIGHIFFIGGFSCRTQTNAWEMVENLKQGNYWYILMLCYKRHWEQQWVSIHPPGGLQCPAPWIQGRKNLPFFHGKTYFHNNIFTFLIKWYHKTSWLGLCAQPHWNARYSPSDKPKDFHVSGLSNAHH